MTTAANSVSPRRQAVFRQGSARQGAADRSQRAGSAGVVVLALLGFALGGAGCAGSDRASVQPQTRQPERARSASDGEIVGANGQAPEDTLEGGATNEHPGPGWVLENGRLVRETEVQKAGERGSEPNDPKAAAGRERDCVADSEQETASEAKAKPDGSGAESEPASRALKRNLKPGCPQPVKH